MSQTRGVPTVDAQNLGTDLHAFSKALGQAWTETGFVAVTNHGIDTTVIDSCIKVSRDFFALPDVVKMKYRVVGGGGQRGYTPFGIETAKDATLADQKEFWHVGRDTSGGVLSEKMPDNIWPEECPPFKEACQTFYGAMDHLGRRLLSAVALYLDQSPDHFESRVSTGNSILRLLHYPPPDMNNAGERAAAHEDINVITLLVGADQAGLEILNRDGTWIPVHADADAIVCNVGDMLERLTNHVLPSTTHRVVRADGEGDDCSRYAAPFFLHFAPDVKIATLPNCITEQRPNRYPSAITAQTFLEQRLAEIGLT
ncbi:MAG: isopenicillin N synthase family oxygenase [Rhodospirillaceae bacterium]|jgi:isopenicillin N synthase-like dioxygenase|nr:isopenicillin N synthase family oxygenase [Rhodospirillaceae bacterium]MBT5567034.1 isopenicillin N synthase family oxygenase [Rhodospirillaceae bacterium]